MPEGRGRPGPVVGHLAVVSHVVHHEWGGRIHAYTPYARELDLWAAMVERVTVVAPLRVGPPPADASPLVADNVTIASQIEAGGDDRSAKLHQLRRLPAMVLGVDRALRGVDAVQVRCPGNLGLIGAVVAPLRSRRVMAKYAGQWRAYPGEPMTWRWQRAILRSRWFRGPVLAYGPSPDDRPHVLPAFSTAIDAASLTLASAVAQARVVDTNRALRVLFVGRLTAAKHVEAVIGATEAVARTGAAISLRVVGDGPERAVLDALAGPDVELVGAVEQTQVLVEYEKADVLVLASESEGWPKAIVEAMAFGVVCIGNDGGMVPTILADGRGLTVRPGDSEAIARGLGILVGDREQLIARSRASAEWASRFSLEAFEDEMRRVLARAWNGENRGSGLLQPPRLRGVVPVAAPSVEPEPLRVLQVIDSLAAGGAERVAVQLANELAGAGHESSLVATRSAGPLSAEIHADVRWTSLQRRRRVDPAAVAQLRAIVRDLRIDVIHAHSSSVFLVAMAFAVGPRPAIVWQDHFPGAAQRDPRPLRAVSPWIDVAAAVSEEIEAADRANLRLGDRLVRVSNFSQLDADAPAAEGLPGEPGERIVCLANLRVAKDQLTVVRAMAEVVRTRPRAHLLLVGADTSDYADEVRAEIERLALGLHVSLLGVRTDVASVLAAADVAVLGSREEGTPLAVLEYGLARLPVVATAVGAVVGLLDVDAEGASAGRMVAPGDPAAIAEELLLLMADPAKREQLGARLHRRVVEEYSAAAAVERWTELYRVAGRRRSSRSSR